MSEFRPGFGLRFGNRVVSFLLRAGLPVGSMALLTVKGRKSGASRTTPVAIAPLDGGWRLVAAYGIVDWVKNLRVAGSAHIERGGKTFEVNAIELVPEEAAPLLQQSLREVGPITRSAVGKYFDTAVDAPIEEWVLEAERHPVFILQPIIRASSEGEAG